MGPKPVMSPSKDSARAVWATSNRSRMTARGMTLALPTPRACTTRQNGEPRHAGAQRAADRADDREHEPAEQRRPAAQVVGKGPEEELAHRQSREKGRQGELDRARARLEVGGDRRQRGQIHVEGEGRQDRDGAQQQQQTGQPGRF